MGVWIRILPQGQTIEAQAGENLLAVLRREGLAVDAPCGGQGKCGKCRVLLNDQEALGCQTVVDRDMTVTLPEHPDRIVLTDGVSSKLRMEPAAEGYLLAFDIGTTTVAAWLLDGAAATQLACASDSNPQRGWGADVVSRLRAAREGEADLLTESIRKCMEKLTASVCSDANILPQEIGVVCVVGNPAMQQLFLGLPIENLITIPFAPVLKSAQVTAAQPYLPACCNAKMLTVPDISGFVGADTVAAVMASGMDTRQETALLVDIGTNGEMVMGSAGRLAACSTAAGPALEGAGVRFGMPGQRGAIDHVWLQDGKIQCSAIGGVEAVGICGSGIIDAVAVALQLGLLNKRGKILHPDGIISLTEQVYLTQEDIRQVQLAKGAIAAGIELLAAHLGITLEQIDRVFLAGAFGTYLDPASACRIGLLPPVLLDKIEAICNAAGAGARQIAASMTELERAGELARRVEAVELAEMPRFSRCFAENMLFDVR